MEIIAEIGQNHNGETSLALELIHAAKENGADVAKFQLYETKTLFPKEGNEWYEYNCKTEIDREELALLAEECQKIDIEFMASVFDTERIAWLEEVGVKRYKIASRSINDKELVHAVTATGKPVLISLGFWKEPGFPKFEAPIPPKYLYCVSQYPTPLTELHLSQIDFNQYDGFSDHSIGTTAALVACARGAQLLEKHFTLDKTMVGPDHECSMTPDELKEIAVCQKEIRECLE